MSSAPQQTILVTGGAGYIGSHVCLALREAGHLPVTVDNLGRGRRQLVKWGPLEEGDITDTDWLSSVIARHRPAAVCHLAGYADVAESIRKPALYEQNNVEGTRSLLTAMRRHDVSRLVFSSSCAVHGIPARIPIAEDSACAPIQPYGQSKLMAEKAIAEAARDHGLQAVILRYFNAAGADAGGSTGECHEPETHVIPLALRAAVKGREFSVFGTDYPTPDGTAMRDYVHVSDIADAHLLALSYAVPPATAAVFNLGTGLGVSVADIVRAVEAETACTLKIRHAERRPGDPPALVADPSRARSILGFRPAQSDIQTIVRTALAWEKHNVIAPEKPHEPA